MKIRCSPLFQLLIAGLSLAACARPVAPEGGPKDTTPPGLDSLRSDRNFATRYSPRRIQLSFDEWIVLKDAGTQIIVSPPLAKRPLTTLRGRTVTLEFDRNEVLRPNTTYTVNFGSAVQDLHEANPAKDLRFVFSTGDFIDSLRVSGSVVDAFTGEAVESVVALLYENLADSAIQKERPYYFAPADKTGQFSIQNVKSSTFRLVVVEDLGLQNLKWDPRNGERIGFPDTLIATDDTARAAMTLRMFKETPAQRLLERNVNRYGRVKLVFAAPPDSVTLQVLGPAADSVQLVREQLNDTLFVWYERDGAGAWDLLAGSDTVAVRSVSRADFLKNNRLVWGDVAAPPAARPRPNQPAAAIPTTAKTVSLTAYRPAVLPFNSLPATFDTTRWLLMLDSARVTDFSVVSDSAAPRRLLLRTAWLPGKTYRLSLLPGAVTDFFGTPNADTLARIFLIYSEKQLGSMALTLQSLQPDVDYVVQILDGNNLEIERRFRAMASETRLAFSNLPTLAYTVRVVEDRNGNGRWDTGNFAQRRQPEVVFSRKLETLRANWEVDIPLDLNEKAVFGKKKKG